MKVLLVEIRENGVWSWEPVARQVDASDPPVYADACFDAICFSPDDLRDIAAEAGVGEDDIRMTEVDAPAGWEIDVREPGFYWVTLVNGQATIARWSGGAWACRHLVVDVLSGRLTPPSKDWLPSPPERVLLDSGKGYREELTVDRVNHATGAVYVSRSSCRAPKAG